MGFISGCPALQWGIFLMALPIFYLDKLKALSVGQPTYHYLSDATRVLLLVLLDGLPSERWTWRNNGQKLTDSEWDEAEAMVSLATEEILSKMMTGMIVEWSLDFLPAGFEWCDGGEISRDSDLGTLLVNAGCPYGIGNGISTVNKPDRRGRVSVGVDTGQSEFEELGQNGGEKSHALDILEIPLHQHSEIIAVDTFINGGLEAPAPAATALPGSTGLAGGGLAHNNLQHYLTLNFIIKT